MKRLLIIILFNLIVISVLPQINMSEKWSQIIPDTVIYYSTNNTLGLQPTISTQDFNSNNCYENQKASINPTLKPHIDSYNNNIRNVQVSRSPVQVLITKDNKYACVRSFLSNSIEIINISTGEIIESFYIPSPIDFVLSHSGTKLIVASLTDNPMPPDPPQDDCSSFAIWLSGKAMLTTIDITSLEITKKVSIETLCISSLLQAAEDSIIYLQGREVIEYNKFNNTIIRRWPFSQQIWRSKIDSKNKKIFLTTIDSISQGFLKMIDLRTGDIITPQLYPNGNGEIGIPFYIGMDTLSNRVFIQGKSQPQSEVLVFDAISLNQLPPIVDARLKYDSFLASPDLGSIFIGADYPDNTMELDYVTLQPKQILSLPIYSHLHKLILSEDKSKLFSFLNGARANSLAQPRYLDIIEYDINTGSSMQYTTTDNKYVCSYVRSIASTNDGQYLIVTNSPENTISILEIAYESINLTPISNLIVVYPNPTLGIINLTINKQIYTDYTIEIYNYLGCLVFKTSKAKSENNITIDITNHPKGQYYLHFNSERHSYFRKIIKH